MSTCTKCGQEVADPATVCNACAAPGSESAAAGVNGAAPVLPPVSAPEPPPLTAPQRALAGAKKGAWIGALYGGAYGAIMWGVLISFAEGIDDPSYLLFRMVVVYGVIVAAAMAVLVGLFRFLVPPKKKKTPSPAESTDAKL